MWCCWGAGWWGIYWEFPLTHLGFLSTRYTRIVQKRHGHHFNYFSFDFKKNDRKGDRDAFHMFIKVGHGCIIKVHLQNKQHNSA